MEILFVFIGLVLLLIILGSLLFLVAQFLVRRMSDISLIRRHLWVWRSFLLVLVVFIVYVMVANKEFFALMFPGPLQIIPIVIMVIFLGSMMEIVIIDLLLPDKVTMWKRVAIELTGFLFLCFVSFYLFNVGVGLLA